MRRINVLEAADVEATAKAVSALGAEVERSNGAVRVAGQGVGGLRAPSSALDFGNSGTGCRLVMGAVAGCPITATFDGDASLRKRPMQRILDPVTLVGARAVRSADGGRLPITLAGARDPVPIVYRTPVPSAQIKSAVLLAGLAAPGETVVIITDGVDEAMNPQNELYTKERVIEFVKHGSAKAEELGKALLADVRRHANGRPQNDDITIMTFSRDPI